MTLIPVTPPAVSALDRQAVWDHLPLDYEAGSPLIEPFEAPAVDVCIADAIGHIDGDTWLGRALMTQTWDYVLDGFPDRWRPGFITIPLPPLQEIISVSYLDSHGVSQVVPPSQYRAVGIGSLTPARLIPIYGACWPVAQCHGGVTIRFKAGFGDGPDALPTALRRALLLLVAHWFRNREAIIAGMSVAEVPLGVKNLLQPFRVFR